MDQIKNLQPQALWERFAEICAIPHPSKHEAMILEYLKNFARQHSLACKQDDTGNIVISKQASPGYENHDTIVLQGHVDMVPQKNSNVKFDFESDPIEPYIDGDWVKARDTTLGADNGIGCAAILAILADNKIKHPPLEAFFTVDEESGLTGALAMAGDLLTGRKLINLDSEDEGELYIGCAGGVNSTAEMKYNEEVTADGGAAYELSLRGLKGGHSGMDIILQRANANKVMVRFLRDQSSKNGVRIAAFDGGSVRNAIPREATAQVVLPAENAAAFEKDAAAYLKQIAAEYAAVEDAIEFTANKIELPSVMVCSECQDTMISALTASPNGVMRMSDTVPGLVETSTNMARVQIAGGNLSVQYMTRCMVNYGKRETTAMIRATFALAGIRVEDSGDYDGWAPNPDSELLAVMKQGYKDLFGKEPDVKAIHAGLECGIIGAKYPGMDMISIGPTIRFPHSPDEKVNIPSVAKFYKFLLYTLENM